MTDLNTAIAFQRGWQIINHHGKKWNLIGTQTIQENAPDFEHDARLYMALLDELQQGHVVIPCGQCNNFDYSGVGCLGHPVKDEDEKK